MSHTINTGWGILKGTLERVCSGNKIPKEGLIKNAVEILTEVEALSDANKATNANKIWLVYGRVQSWKTNAMITTTALAFDNGYKIAIILTSNNTELVWQTKERFERSVYGTDYFIRTVEYRELKNITYLPLKEEEVRLVIVVSKWSKALETTITYLSLLDRDNHKAIIFDDEGDNYSLDNNRKDRDDDEELPPTKINELIFRRLTNKIDHVLVSVTWTPQGVLLEWTNQSLWFKYLLEPWLGYVWWKDFFEEEDIENNNLVHEIDPEEVVKIFETSQMWEWLAHALFTFYTAATLYSYENDWARAQFLCHPNLKVDFHRSFYTAIQNFHNSVMSQFMEWNLSIKEKFRGFYDGLKTKDTTIHFDQFLKLLRYTFIKTSIVQLNAQHKDNRNPLQHEILIGGNILWRWLTIDDMIVMYYWRNAKVTNMDTLYQHARMFWYRKNLLKYMRIYMPLDVYQKFHYTYETDEWLREMVKLNPYENFEIKYYDKTGKLRFTRPNIESKSFLSSIFIPRQQLKPNNIPKEEHEYNHSTYETIWTTLEKIGTSEELMTNWVLVSLEQVHSILKLIKTNNNSSKWEDGKVMEILSWLLSDATDKKIRLYKTVSTKGFDWRDWYIPSGSLHSDQVKIGQAWNEISLWLTDFFYKPSSSHNLGRIWYPTIVFPKNFWIGKIFILNK